MDLSSPTKRDVGRVLGVTQNSSTFVFFIFHVSEMVKRFLAYCMREVSWAREREREFSFTCVTLTFNLHLNFRGKSPLVVCVPPDLT